MDFLGTRQLAGIERKIDQADAMPPAGLGLEQIGRAVAPAAQIDDRLDAAPGEAERVEDIGIEQLGNYVTKLTPEAEAVAATVREAVAVLSLASVTP